MSLQFYNWSRNAGDNATADSNVNWAEGQSPSSVNDSARAMMSSTAAFRDDIAGAIVTAGTSTAYTVSSYQVFDTLAHLNAKAIAFTPHTTNGATVTLNVDGLGAKPLRSAPTVELPAGVIVQGTPYIATYNNTDGAFYLQGFYGNPYNIMIGASIDYWGTTAPNSSFVLSYGQAISRTTYSTLFSLVGTTYGTGDGTTTFNIPDIRGRVIAGMDNMGGVAAGRIGTVVTDSGTIVGTSLGSAGGSATHVLTGTEMPAHSHANSLSDPGHTHVENIPYPGGGSAYAGSAGSSATAQFLPSTTPSTNSATTGITINNANAGGGGAHAILQPTILALKLIRII
ncbi:phage tail protein [Bradyrhizobium centrolobii]|uniref:Phage tail protein n=1 Tax=Bradyrhizobium centrolobii TaxID=1505087 RepID=A0A176YFR1_9BRAD|nr:tail fiber protein [Bradyrhizobium centrolobii]OAF05472.1 phage tail protein [Bradyrhizobium centrolobii]